MNRIRKFPFGFIIFALAVSAIRAEVIESDVCIYGGTACGVAAAVETARLGKTAVLVEFGYHIGGMTSGGLSQTDIGNKGAIGGISREFYQRMGRHYGQPEQWQLEPSVAENILFEMLNEEQIPIYFHQRLLSVEKDGARITEIRMAGGKIYRAKEFIDATYEGDLMVQAKVSFTVGREANAQYSETLDGIRGKTPKHQFLVPVDPYLKAGDSNSGLLKFIQAGDGGAPGEADNRVQAYNFRFCITQNPANMRPIDPPKKYNADDYELLARYIEALVAAGKAPQLGDLMHIQAMPNGKTDVNNNGGFSTDFIGANYDYPNADYTKRALIWQQHEDYSRGMFHFLATSPRVPDYLQKQTQSWGLANDEFYDTGGWPHQLYVREARRMVSDYVMTEHNCRESTKVPDAIALAAYTMDSHNCQRIVKDGHAENEGDTQVHGFPPYPIAYRAIVPKISECENLFVPVCLSASHIAYGSIRMEPVFMVLGHSSAAAAVQAIHEKVAVQKIDVASLQSRLLAEHQVLEWTVKGRK